VVNILGFALGVDIFFLIYHILQRKKQKKITDEIKQIRGGIHVVDSANYLEPGESYEVVNT